MSDFGNRPPFFTNYGVASGSTPGLMSLVGNKVWSNTTAQPGTLASWIIAGQTGVAEVIASYSVSDDAVAKLEIMNQSSVDATFVPMIRGTGKSTGFPLVIRGSGTTDTGTNALMFFDTVIGASTTPAVRPLYAWAGNGGVKMQMAASGLLDSTATIRTTGVSTPSAGAGIELSYSGATGVVGAVDRSGAVYRPLQLNGSTVALAPNATTMLSATATEITTSGGRIRKTRVALTSPVTVTTSDDIVLCKLTTPGAVAVSLPGSPAAGREYLVIDATGDSLINNITVTPAAGNINGAGTNVIGANYARRSYVYDSSATAQWLAG